MFTAVLSSLTMLHTPTSSFIAYYHARTDHTLIVGIGLTHSSVRSDTSSPVIRLESMYKSSKFPSLFTMTRYDEELYLHLFRRLSPVDMTSMKFELFVHFVKIWHAQPQLSNSQVMSL